MRPLADPQRQRPVPVVLLRPVPGRSRHPRAVGRHQTACRVGHFGVVDVLPGLGGDRAGGGAGAGRGVAGAYSPRCAAVGAALAVDPAGARRCHCGIGRRQSDIDVGSASLGLGGLLDFLRITALSIVLLGLGAHGVVDHQCRRNRARGGHFGPPAAAVADPGRRVVGRFGAGAARLPDADRRIPGALRRAPVAAQTGAPHAAGAPAALGAGS